MTAEMTHEEQSPLSSPSYSHSDEACIHYPPGAALAPISKRQVSCSHRALLLLPISLPLRLPPSHYLLRPVPYRPHPSPHMTDFEADGKRNMLGGDDRL